MGQYFTFLEKRNSRLFPFFSLIFLLFFQVGWGQTITIGTGTDKYYNPMPGWYGWQYDVYLYDAADITTSGNITSIAYYISTSNSNTTGKMQIWFKAVPSSTTLSASSTFNSYISGATQVYTDNAFNGSTTGWKTLTLSTPFTLASGESLLVAVRGVGCTTSGGCYKEARYTAVTNKRWYKNQDGSDPGQAVTGTLSNQRANIQLVFTPSVACTTPPTGGTTVLTPNFGAPSSTVNGSVTGASSGTGLTYQWQYSDTGSAPWTDITGQTSANLTTTAKPTFGTRYYRRAITCSGQTSYSASAVYTTQLVYCNPVSTSGDNISGFVTSGGTTNINNPVNNGGNNGGYTDFYNTHSASIPAGLPLNFQTWYVGGGSSFAIWVDFNENGVFDASERLYNHDSSTTSPYSGSITIPGSTAPGTYRMRIRAQYGSNVVDPCASITYGEAEDYKLIVLAPPSCMPPSGLNTSAVGATTATINWTAASPAPGSGYQYYVSTFTTPPTGSTTPSGSVGAGVTTANLTGLTANTTYYVWVRSNCGGSQSTWIGPISFTTACNPYTIPYFEGFESGYTDGTMIAGCLTQEAVGGTAPWTANSSLTTYNRSPRTGSWNAFLQYGSERWLFIPLQLTGGKTYKVELYARQDDTSGASIEVKYGTNKTNAAMTNTIVASTNLVNGNYQKIEGNFTVATSGVYYVGIKGNINFTPWYISLDDISITEVLACTTPPTGGTTVLTPNSGAPSSTVNGSVTGDSTGSGLTYQWQYSDTGSDPWTNITGQTGANLTTTAISGIGTRYYRRAITCSGQTAYSTSAVYTTTYCTPTTSSGSSYYISNFTTSGAIANINNNSGGNASGYTDFTGSVAPLQVELNSDFNYSISVAGGSSYGRAVWIDFNKNGIFEAGEQVASSNSYDNPPLIGSIHIPATALAGVTRMRVLASFSPSNPSNPCSNSGSGEYEDYLVDIVIPSCPSPLDLNLVQTAPTLANISWTAPATPPSGYEYAVTTSATPPASGTYTTSTSVNGVNIVQGTVNYLHVRSVCGVDYGSWKTYSKEIPPDGQIGITEGTTGQLPIYSCYGYNYSQQLYYAHELSAALGDKTQITKIRFYYESGGTPVSTWNDWTIYMGNTSKGAFTSNSDWIPLAQMTQVFTGIISVPSGGNWLEITLDTPFDWDEISNLVIAVDENSSSYSCTANFGSWNDYSLGTNGRSLLYYNDSTNPNPASPPTANGWYVTINTLQLAGVKPCAAEINTVSVNPICGGDTAGIIVNASAPTTELRLYTTATGGSPIATISGNSGTFTTPVLNATTTFYVEAVMSGCVSSRTSVTVVVKPAPTDLNIVETTVPASATDACEVDYVKLDAIGGNENNVPIFTEDFSSSGNWAYSGPTGIVGYFYNSANAGGVAPEGGLGWNSGSNVFDMWLFMPYVNSDVVPININGYSNLNLSFKHKLETYNPSSYYINIFVAIDDGEGIDIVWDTVATGNIGPATVNVDLSAYDGKDEIFIYFGYYGDSYGLDDWYLDDILISGTKQANITWSPATGLYTDAALTTPYVAGTNAATVYAAPAGTEIYTATASTPANSCTKDDQAQVDKFSSEFIAATGNWNVASNWFPAAVPDITKCVKVPNGKKLTINVNNAEAKNLTVEAGGELEIAANQALTLQDFVKNNSTVDKFVVKDGASLVQINDGDINAGAIKVEKQFNFSAGRQQYNFVSIPVKDFFLKGSGTNNPLYAGMTYVLKYNEATDYFVNAFNADHITGKGFAIKEASTGYANDGLGVFTGVPFNGNASISLAKTGQGFNVIGNPYPSTLDLAQFYTDNNTKIESTVWFWDNRGNTLFEQQGSTYAGTNYASYNFVAGGGTGVAAPSGVTPTKYLRPGTGFMVQAKNNGAQLNFSNSQRVTNNAPAFAGKNANLDEVNRYWLYMETPDQLKVNMAVVYFGGGNNAYGIDDSDAFGSSDELYALIGNNQVIIQGKSPFVDTDVVPLGFRAFKQGNYKIAIPAKEGIFEDGQKIYLRDKDLGVTHDFSQGAYSFKTRKGEFNNRFEIVYKPNKKASMNNLSEIANVVNIQKVNQQIEVTSTVDKIVEVEIFNLSGRSIVKAKNIHELNWTMPTKTIDKQILVVVVKTETGEVVTKKVITK